MSVVVITPPEPIVSTAEAKKHLRVEGEDDDAYIDSLVMAAQMTIDGPDGWLGRAVGVQDLEYRCDGVCGAFMLPYKPIISIVSVAYRDAVGAFVTVPPSNYELTGCVLSLVPNGVWSHTGVFSDALRVRYKAGYGKASAGGDLINDAPAPIKQAILLLVGQWYAFRENVAPEGRPGGLPFTVEALLAPYRIWT